MKIAVEGCAHGELNNIYATVEHIEKNHGVKVDLLICCGDFQSVRDKDDMLSMAVPPKYQHMKDFHEYYTGKRKAPVLTLFIAGNHESANYLWELPYGGWVAENIYYLGYAGVINFGGFRIGGLSGIFKGPDYHKGHFELPPFNDYTKRSFYHVRSLDVGKLKLLRENKLDIFLSHDWPKGIYKYGDSQELMRFKPFLKKEIEQDILGSPAAEELLHCLKPKFWFSAHLHAKFVATVPHSDSEHTKFLALDKCLPNRNFLQVLDIGPATSEMELKYDEYWISVLQQTGNYFSKSSKSTLFTEITDEYLPTEKKIANILTDHSDLTVFPFIRSEGNQNGQTIKFCEKFNIFDPCSANTVIVNNTSGSSQKTFKKMNIPKPKLDFEKIRAKNKKKKQVFDRNDEDDFGELTNPNLSRNNVDDDEDDFGELSKPRTSVINEDSDVSESGSEKSDEVGDWDELSEKPSLLSVKKGSQCNSNLSAVKSPEASRIEKEYQYDSNISTVESPHTLFKERKPSQSIKKGYQYDSNISTVESPYTSLIESTPKTSPRKTIDPEKLVGNDTLTTKEEKQTPTLPKKRFKLVRRNQDIYSTKNDEDD